MRVMRMEPVGKRPRDGKTPSCRLLDGKKPLLLLLAVSISPRYEGQSADGNLAIASSG
ncbi:MAG: hypothetical protein KatS3mg111_2133 [Pirellulaceae bacterium]|nr:MAG: hypothetical protein KatS3mg111_2133 [Pirellulaceae bacterium]